METIESAKNLDPSLYYLFIGGRFDGLKSGDLPVTLSGKKLTDMVMEVPLVPNDEPMFYAVYKCIGETQVNGFWQFFYQGIECPGGEFISANVVKPAEEVEPVSSVESDAGEGEFDNEDDAEEENDVDNEDDVDDDEDVDEDDDEEDEFEMLHRLGPEEYERRTGNHISCWLTSYEGPTNLGSFEHEILAKEKDK